MELDELTKERLLLEEKYRSEIRDQLNSAKTPENRMTKFLNSSFGLWLLSAVFISGAGTIYQNWQESRDKKQLALESNLQEQRSNQQALKRLDLEISFRISQALLQLSTVSERVEALMRNSTEEERRIATANLTFEVISGLGSTVHDGRASLYPEYIGFPLPTLLVELRRTLEGNSRTEVEESLASLSNISTSMNFGLSDSIPEDAARSILEKIVLDRWTKSAFDYVDCDPTTPFCN